MIRIEDSIAYMVYRTQRLLRVQFIQLMNRNGIELFPEQWFVINKLIQRDGQSQVELSESLFKDKPNMTRILQGLEKKDLISRQKDLDDSRIIRVYLTANARKLHKKIEPIVFKERGRVFKNLSEEDIARFKKVIHQLEHNMLLEE